MNILPSSGKKPSEAVRCEWVAAAIYGAAALGSAAMGYFGSDRGGGGDYAAGAPDWYYEHLRHDVGEPQAEMAQEMYNFYKYGQMDEVPLYTTDPIKEIEVGDAETIYLNANGKNMGGRQDLYNEGWTDQEINQYLEKKEVGGVNTIYELPDGQRFDDRERAINYGINRGILEAPNSPLSLERERLEVAREMLPRQQEILEDFYNEAGRVDPEQYADRAQADVAQKYAAAGNELRQNILRTGARPGSARSAAMQADLQTRQARDTASARTMGRMMGDEVRFRRLSQAVGGPR